METTPLALVVLLGFGLLIAVCLTAWTAVSYDSTGNDDAAERPQRPFVSSEDERPPGRRGAQAQRPARVERGDGAGRGSRTDAGGGLSGESGEVTSKANQSALSGGAWRSAGGATVTARRIEPQRPVDTGTTGTGASKAGRASPDSEGGRGGRPKQTRGTRADQAERKQEHDEDAFERFLRARPDDIDIG